MHTIDRKRDRPGGHDWSRIAAVRIGPFGRVVDRGVIHVPAGNRCAAREHGHERSALAGGRVDEVETVALRSADCPELGALNFDPVLAAVACHWSVLPLVRIPAL